MPAERIAALLEHEPSLREALSIVVERTDGGAAEVDWPDVRDELTSGQWGRLIGRGVLVEGESGFALDDPEAAIQAVGRADSADSADAVAGAATLDDVEPESWSLLDKGAGVVSLVFFLGYSQLHIRNVIASVDNVVLAPVDAALPFYVVILLLSVVTGFYSTVIQGNLMDYEKMGRYRERIEDVKERLDAAKEREDEDAIERLEAEQREAMGDQLGMFKLQFRPMVYVMLLTIPIFLWMRWKIRAGHLSADEMRVVFPLVGTVGWRDAVLGPMPAWIVWYFLCSMGFRQIIQKSLNLRTSPS